MLSGHSTVHISKKLCLTPQQKIKLKRTVGGFLFGAVLVYGGTLLGKECDSSLSTEELYEFMKQSMNWLLPASIGGGLITSGIAYLKARALASEIPIINIEDYYTPLNKPGNIQSLDDSTVFTPSGGPATPSEVFTPSNVLVVPSEARTDEDEIDSSVRCSPIPIRSTQRKS